MPTWSDLVRDGRALIVAEVAQAHDGSLGLAHAYIDAIASAGADAVKFQTHIAAAESTPHEPWRVRFSVRDATRFDYWKRMEFAEPEWRGLRDHVEARGLLFISSPFSMEAVDLLCKVGVSAWKVASGEVTSTAMLDRMAVTGLPIILSSGMSTLDELDDAKARVARTGSSVTVLQCTSAYPCPPERVGLNLLTVFRSRYGCRVGLSDHSGTIYPGLAAAALGADLIEIHVVMSRESFGPDVPASITTAELRQLVDGVRFIEAVRSHPVDKDALARELAPLRSRFTKSVVARHSLPAGTVLQEEHLALKKPGTGIAPARLPELIGRRLRRALQEDELLQDADLVTHE